MSAVVVDREGTVAIVRLRRDAVLNAVDPPMLAELLDAVERTAADRSARAIVLTGTDRAFCTGEDLDVAARMDAAAFEAQVEGFQRLATLLRSAPQPVIAAVAGYAYGAGLEIAVNCDVRIAADNATFACPEVEWGLTLTNGASVLLRRLVGDGWAREVLMLGRVVDAETAERIGLVTRVVALDELERTAVDLATVAAEGSEEAMAATKALLNAEHGSWQEIVDAELEAVMRAFASPHATERLQGFALRTKRDRADG